MPSPDETAYIEFFLNSRVDIVQFECLELVHPDFSQIYRFVRNNTDGLRAKLETDEYGDFAYVPVAIRQGEMIDDLDFSLEVELGDLGEILPLELDNIAANDGFITKPQFIYRSYRSDDLENILFGPLKLEVVTFGFNKTGAKFEAVAPRLNVSRTGEIYTIARFPGLRDFL